MDIVNKKLEKQKRKMNRMVKKEGKTGYEWLGMSKTDWEKKIADELEKLEKEGD